MLITLKWADETSRSTWTPRYPETLRFLMKNIENELPLVLTLTATKKELKLLKAIARSKSPTEMMNHVD